MYHLCDWHGTMPASAWRLVDAQHQACGAGLTSGSMKHPLDT